MNPANSNSLRIHGDVVVNNISYSYTETLWQTCVGGICTSVADPFSGIKNEESGEQSGTIVCHLGSTRPYR